MKKIKEITVKNGRGFIVYVWEIEESKPKCWIESGKYQFNSTLVYSYSITIHLNG